MVKSKNKNKRRAYPEKHRKYLAQKARENKPWESATGPKTTAGKAAISQNARKHGLRSAEILTLRRLLRKHAEFLKRHCEGMK